MKTTLVVLFSFLTLSAFADHNRHGSNQGHSPRTVHSVPRGGAVVTPRGHVVTPGRRRSNRPRFVGPRYNPPGSFRRLRTSYRVIPVITGFSCSFATLYRNGYPVHNFYSVLDCRQAVADIYSTSDFCDYASLYDQSGLLQATFSSGYECREALGWYY